MTTKKALKQRSHNVFEKATGVQLYKLEGELDCQVAPHTRITYEGGQYMLGHVAAAIYLNKPADSFTRVQQTCGIKNCVFPRHLIIDGQSLSMKDSGELLKKEIDNDAPDEDGNIHGIHHSIWVDFNDYQKSLARTGKYTQVEIGYMKYPPVQE